MDTLFFAVAVFILANLSLGLVRVVRGPRPADRMMAAQLFGTTAVAVLVLLAQALAQPGLRDVALIFAILAAVAAVAFVKHFGTPPTSAE
ncbi:MAG: multiple resistance and pH regulation protein F [Truepera sp.]|nr:multiple resistance and pH regulation protein F [Truepera sp.]MBS3967113.1 multiple resistance and pH regulation protein F [Truepera sp.]